MKDVEKVTIAAIATLGIIGYQVSTSGIDGSLISVVVAAVAGLGGYSVAKLKASE